MSLFKTPPLASTCSASQYPCASQGRLGLACVLNPIGGYLLPEPCNRGYRLRTGKTPGKGRVELKQGVSVELANKVQQNGVCLFPVHVLFFRHVAQHGDGFCFISRSYFGQQSPCRPQRRVANRVRTRTPAQKGSRLRCGASDQSAP